MNLHHKPVVNVTFKSTKTPKEVYTIMFNDLQTAVTLASGNKQQLTEIRLDLMATLAVVDNMLERIHREQYR